jgi:hypothetical protein
MNKLKTGLLIVSLVLIHSLISAQLPDGVTLTQSFLNEIINNYKEENSIKFDPVTVNIRARIPIRTHIIMNIKGTAGVNLTYINNSVIMANSFFKNAGIEFYIDSIDYVNDYNYSYITYNNLRKELLTRYTIKDRINLFLADSIEIGFNKYYGYTYFPDVPDSNLIFLDKNYLGGNALTTMLGHFMGLLSTHETLGGRELASEKNCAISGDYVCDTYADPDLFSMVVDSCKYIGTMRDDGGRYFVPSVANIMSNSPDMCKCILTPLQYRRIYYYYNKYRQYLKN